MAGGSDRNGAPPSERLALQHAVVTAALDKSGILSAVPFTYSLDRLAQRWHVPPWVVEEAPLDWLLRGIEFERIEAVKTETS